ncbi:MAG: histidine phosphatase family protein [Desulfobacterales bacterium]|nr:histidine phosphatase family protein [Desulfobacterales bacterium]
MGTLYMIRHGQASFGKDNYDKLSDLGEHQAKLLAAYFVRKKLNFDMIYTGTLLRHRETAQSLIEAYKFNGFKPCEVKESKSFDEYDFKAIMKSIIPVLQAKNPQFNESLDLIFKNSREFQYVFETAMIHWMSGNDNPPDLPSWNDFKDKVADEINFIMQNTGKGKKIAIFTSGGPIAATIQKVLQLSDYMTLKITCQIINSSVSRFKFNKESIMLSVFNDCNHLEIEERIDFITYI